MVKGTNLLPSLNLVLQVLKQQSPPMSGETDKKLCQDILEKEWKARKKFLLDNFSEAVPMLSHELDGWPPMASWSQQVLGQVSLLGQSGAAPTCIAVWVCFSFPKICPVQVGENRGWRKPLLAERFPSPGLEFFLKTSARSL